MEIQKALEFLKEYLGEVEYLRTLHPDNEEQGQLKNKVNVVLEAAFGKASDEYKSLNPSAVSYLYDSEEKEREAYLKRLDNCETRIKGVLNRYEILGVKRISKFQEGLKWFKSGLILKPWQWVKSHKIISIVFSVVIFIAAVVAIIQFFLTVFS